MMSSDKYQVILADPPWSYLSKVQHGGAKAPFTSSAASFYGTMTVDEICDMRPFIDEIADKPCILFIWIPGPLLLDGLRVIDAWGFKYKRDVFQWNKCRVNPGAYTMTQLETCYVAVRGSIPKPRGARNVRQYIEEPRTAHSRKPLEVHRRIDAMFPELRKIELFARPPHPSGWDVWGNEAAQPHNAELAGCGS